MHFYARKPAEHFRPLSVLEAEAADRVVLEEVFQLCFSGHTLSDALSHVIVDRDMLRHVLVEKPKISNPRLPRSFVLQLPAPKRSFCVLEARFGSSILQLAASF